MILDDACFQRIKCKLESDGYPTSVVSYSGAETIRDGNEVIPVVWFTCRDRRFTPRKGQIVGFDEDFQIRFTKPLVITTSVLGKMFSVVCSKGGRTVSLLNGAAK